MTVFAYLINHKDVLAKALVHDRLLVIGPKDTMHQYIFQECVTDNKQEALNRASEWLDSEVTDVLKLEEL